ncbi:MAG TPA: type I glyceraldehyde-3-phosphate dehydrogenase, partial [Bacteroidia bacterium]|nr:type I glyceraldehyde-3-phosphate dehydrogenase [Bacteroidia bacterium]
MIHIAINGFGRIGRTLLRQLLQMPQIKIVAINDLADAQTLAHLFKYDSIHGLFDGTVASQAHAFVINEQEIPLYNEREPQNLPWKQLDVDILIECSGKFTSYDKAILHHHAGARKVIISAPATGNLKSVVIGVNEQILDGSEIVVSNASCTTNNAAPMLKVLNDNWGIESAFITTVHAFTGDQNLHDAPHKDLRRARAATQSIIPTTTGAAKAITDIFPEMKGHIGGAGI